MDKKKLVEKILKDEPKGFRKKFLDNPKKTLEEIVGGSLGDMKVVINRYDENTFAINLPKDLKSPEIADVDVWAGVGTLPEPSSEAPYGYCPGPQYSKKGHCPKPPVD
jgi:hypothetical protein